MTIREYYEDPNTVKIASIAHTIKVYENFAIFAETLLTLNYGSRVIRQDLTTDDVGNIMRAWMFAHDYEYTVLYNSTQQKYNPIENYNMVEEGGDKHEIESHINTGANTTTVSVAPFDSNAFQAAQQSSTPAIQSSSESTDALAHKLTRSGNIGVTTTQQMIEQERNIARLSLAEKLAKEIANLISIGIYDYSCADTTEEG